ncbi:MAG: 4Fe-4S dicluster domain-containing protein, partial [Bacteroidia bacterium]|nr:4Fe-4S dicluster domain-containing protein [Bacteroidia bacterium]
IPMKPSQEGKTVLSLYNKLAALAGKSPVGGGEFELAANSIGAAANDLWNAKGKALVVCGSNDPAIQQLVIAINSLLGSYGSTIDTATQSYVRQGIDSEVNSLVEEMASGKVNAILIVNSNPLYNLPLPKFKEALGQVGLRISFSSHLDETSSACNYILPVHHYLESWGDAEPVKGYFYLRQPTINHLHKTRHFEESLLKWSGDTRDYYTYLKDNWAKNIYPKQKTYNSAEECWKHALHDGLLEIPATDTKTIEPKLDVSAAAGAIKEAGSGTELILYTKVGIGTGEQASNPWLQEFPDPISKATWDNYIAISRAQATKLNLKEGQIAEITAGSQKIKLPILIQPGQMNETISIALGYGRRMGGEKSEIIGQNAFPLVGFNGNNFVYFASDVKITGTNEDTLLARTQTHNTMMVGVLNRPAIVKETTLAAWAKDPESGNKEKFELLKDEKGNFITLWDIHPKNGHYWGMAIDLNLCTGCGACVVACQVENNVPVVGKDEVRRARELHWIRIDRYFSSEKDNPEVAVENPKVVFMPMMCQHCDNAPCETVCPVLAIAHSSEGINQQVYNRCVGTRYCANNCPYKVRRFNWLDYTNKEKFP